MMDNLLSSVGGDRRDDDVLPGAERDELRNRAVGGARWLVASQGVTEVVAFLSTVALARLLSPVEYGYASSAIIFPTLAEVLLYEGFGTTLVRRRDATRREAGVAVTLSLLLGLTLFCVVFFGAMAASPVLHGSQQSLFQLAAFAFLLSAPNVVPQALQQRQMAFKLIASREATALVIGSLASVGLALAGLGGAAVIGGLLVRRLAVTVFLWAVTERVPPRWDRRVAREAVGFGTPTSIAGVLVLAKRNVDYFILGFFLPARQLGFYYRAYSIGVEYQGKVSTIATRMALPLYSRAADLQDMWRMRKRFSRLQMAIVVPILATFVATASLVIPVVFGARWSPAIVPAQILVVVPVLGLIGAGTGPLLMAAGRPAAVAASNGASLVLYAVTIWLAASGNLLTLSIVVAAFNAIFTVSSTYVLINRVLGFSIVPLLQEITAPVLASTPTLALAWLWRHLDPSLPYMLLAVAATALWCLATYCTIMRLAFPETWKDVSSVVRQFLSVRRTRRGP